MSMSVNPSIGMYVVNPTTGDLILQNPDGSTTTMSTNSSGTTTTTRNGTSNDQSQFAQSAVKAGLSTIAGDNRDTYIQSSLAGLAAISGDQARYSYLTNFANEMQAWSNSQAAAGYQSQAAADFFANASQGLRDSSPGLADHLGATGQSIANKAQASFDAAAAANRAAAASGTEAAAVAAKYANAGALVDAIVLLDALSGGDTNQIGQAAVGALAGIAAGLIATGLGAPIGAAILVGIAAGIAADIFWDAYLSDWAKQQGNFWDNLFDSLGLGPDINDPYNSSRNWQRRYDPIVLDLDGDGIESIAANGAVLFDHDGDLVSSGTGWVSPDDGILVLDKNGNGVIDDGTELFGDGNPDSVRGLNDPADLSAGIIALRKYDSNNDGNLDANDSAYTAIKVWRDLNQDGISQADELFSLSAVGIQSINLMPTSTDNINVGNGNIADSTGQFTRADGSSGSYYDLLLASNPFYREFKGAVALTDKAKTIADMKGSGMVRDLREAASIDDTLADAIAALTPGMSHDEMISRMDAILLKWANTSSMRDTHTRVSESEGVNGSFHVFKSGDAITDLTQIVSVLERFNGSYFFGQNPNGGLRVGNVDYAPTEVTANGSVTRSFGINLEPGSADLLMKSYEALKSSVYGALVLQTRLKSYMQDFELKLDSTQFSVDVSKALTRLDAKYAANQEHALEDAADLMRYAGGFMGESSLAMLSKLETWVNDLSATDEGRETLQAAGFTLANGGVTLADTGGVVVGGVGNDSFGGQDGVDVVISGSGDDYVYTRGGRDIINAGHGNDTVYAGEGNDVVAGGDGNDVLYGENGDDVLLGEASDDRLMGGAGHDLLRGGDGNDTLLGNDGDDQLQGGSGSDTLNGGTGNNTYLFDRGDGNDIVTITHDASTEKKNVLVLGEGITASDITLKRVYDSNLGGDGALQVVVQNPNGQADTITFNGFLYGDDPANAYNGLQFIQFADGTLWTLGDITTELFEVVDGSIRGTVGNDVLHGTEANNKLQGLAGNDTLQGEGGDDELYGGIGNDILAGGAGVDSLDGGAGDDVLDGGTGNDRLNGGTGNNTYLFGLGDGQDIIAYVFDDAVGKSNTLRFKSGISIEDVTVRQVASSWGGQDLLLKVGSSGDQVLVKGFFDQDNPDGANNPLQRVEFADGSFWTVADLLARIYGGTQSDDTLSGTVANDAISGALGNDQLYGRAGDDTLNGGEGDDSLYGEDGDDVLLGGEGSDTLWGGEGSDTLDGGVGNDRLAGGRGVNRYLFGIGDGQDLITAQFDDTLGKVNTLAFKVGVGIGDIVLRQLHGGFGSSDLEVSIIGTDDKLIIQQFIFNDTAGHASNPIQRFEFADGTVWTLEQIQERLFAGTVANDVLRGTSAGDEIHGAAGNDSISGGAGADILTGGDGDDWLDGQQDNDTLIGGAGNDYLHGCDNDDILDGGAGNDRLVGNAGQNVFRFGHGDGQDLILDNSDQGIGSFNALELKAGVAPGDITLLQVSESSGGPRTGLRIGIAGTSDHITIQNYFKDHDPNNALNPVQQVRFSDGTIWTVQDVLNRLFAGTSGDDSVEGTVVDDIINGGQGNDTLLGMSGNDTLNGGAGNDVLDGGDAADQMSGGQGDDLYRVDDYGDTVIEANGEGLDTIESSIDYTLPSHVEVLKLVGEGAINATGNADGNRLLGNEANNVLDGLAGDDVLEGLGGHDTLLGGLGNDTLDGGTGSDHLAGGAGNDTYVVDQQDDVVVELAGEGSDTVIARSDFTLSDHVESLILSEGYSAYNGTGNAGDNLITGNSAANRLDGAAGADRMVGGTGNDTYVVDNVGDDVVEVAGEGIDTVEASIDYVLGSTLENLILTGTSDLQGTGNDGDNVLIGNAGSNRLDGGLGGDDMYGGDGDDTFVNDSSDDWIYENEGAGIDTVERRYETNLILSSNVENLVLAAGIATGNGNDLDNVITGNASANTLGGWDGDDTLHGLDGDDNLFGVNGNDTLYGGAGNDYLDGGTGVDYLEGGAGNDVYITDDSNDVVVEAVGAGTDQVQTTASYTLSANIENLFLMGSAAIDGTGNDLDNYIAGNSGANVINGGGGNDTISAGGGDDTLAGGTGDDKYVFDASSGSDVIDNSDGGFDGVFFTNGITRQRLSFSRDGDDLLISIDAASTPAVRVLNHFLGGNSAIDYVQPDGGYYLTTTEINQIVAGGGTGGQYDQVIVGTASGEQLVGSAGKDLIQGLAGDDQLFGLGGNDTLQGGDGADYLAGGNGSGSGSGNDRLEGGVGADTLSGEDGANTLIGGAGDDDYVYGGGQDTIDNTGGGYDGVFFNNGITAQDLTFSRDGDDLVVTVAGNATGFVRVTGHFLGGDSALDFVQPASGSLLDTAAINALADPDGGGGDPGGGGNEGNDGDYPNVVTGTSAGEQLLGSSGRDLIQGLAGDDNLFGFGGDDKLVGGDGADYLSGGNGSFSGSGNDILVGGAGDDTLVGEDGNDMLIGGAGDDFYYYATGSNFDTVDNIGGGTDWLYFADVGSSRLSYHQDGDDLVVLVDGDLSQGFRVLDHFLGGEAAIAYVQPSSGYAISAAQIANQLTPLPGNLAAQGGGSFAQTMSMSVQRLGATAASLEATADTDGNVQQIKLSSRTALLTQEQVFEPQAANGSEALTPSLRKGYVPRLMGLGDYADVWSEMDRWDRGGSRVSLNGFDVKEGYGLIRRGSAGIPTTSQQRLHSSELDQLISAMAGFRGGEADVVNLGVHERHQSTWLVTSVM